MRTVLVGLLAWAKRLKWSVVAPLVLAALVAGGIVFGVSLAQSSHHTSPHQVLTPLDSSTPTDSPTLTPSDTPTLTPSPTPSTASPTLPPTPSGAPMYYGRAVNESGQPISGLYAYLGDPVLSPNSTGTFSASTRTGSDGTFTLPCPEREPILLSAMVVNGTPGTTATSIENFGDLSKNYALRYAEGTGFNELPPCASQSPVTTVMTPGAILTGHYYQCSGTTNTYGGIWLNRGGLYQVFIWKIVNDEYRFVGLATGTYTVFDDDASSGVRDSSPEQVSVVAGETTVKDWYQGSGWSEQPNCLHTLSPTRTASP